MLLAGGEAPWCVQEMDIHDMLHSTKTGFRSLLTFTNKYLVPIPITNQTS